MNRRDDDELDDLEEQIADRDARSPGFLELVAAAQRKRRDLDLFDQVLSVALIPVSWQVSD